MNILITICARGGSMGIPGKNIKLNLGFYEYRKQDALAIWGDESYEILSN